MTDTEYLKIMYSLGDELERSASAEPYDPDAYNNVIDAINRTNRIWWRDRRLHHWFTTAAIIVFIALAAWIACSIFW